MSRYQLHFRDAFGNPLYVTNELFSFEMTRREMGVGVLDISMPYKKPLQDIVKRDMRIDVMRSTAGSSPYLEGDTTWFIRKFTKKENAKGEFLSITAYDAITMLFRRIIPYKKTSTEADFTGNNDNNLKQLVRLNCGALATDVLRQLNPALFSVDIDFSIFNQNIIDGSYKNLLDEIVANCDQALNPATGTGRYLTFDIVCKSATQLEFRTYADQRGADKTVPPNALTFSIKNKNLKSIEVTDDATDEYNVVYAGGAGENQNRTLVVAIDTARATYSPWSRIERFLDGQGDSSTEALTESANKELVNGRPKRTVLAEIQENKNCRYGIHYQYGDLVNVEASDEVFQCHFDTLSIKYERGRETINPILHGEKAIT